jgi:hypothetical protein
MTQTEMNSATDRSPAAPRAGFGECKSKLYSMGVWGWDWPSKAANQRPSMRDLLQVAFQGPAAGHRPLPVGDPCRTLARLRTFHTLLQYCRHEVGNRLKIAIENAVFSTEDSDSRRSEKYDEQVYGWNCDSEMLY